MKKKRPSNYITRESWDIIADNIIWIVESNLHDPDEQTNRLADYLEGEGIVEIGTEDDE